MTKSVILSLIFLLTGSIAISVATETFSPQNFTLPNAAIAEDQDRLLTMGFATASTIPIVPHQKDRSRAQAAVVKTCLSLGQAKRALEFIQQIEDWRQGECYADLAFHCVQNGIASDVTATLDLASSLAEQTEDWRRDRIRARIAQTYTLFGNPQLATEFEEGVNDAERGKVVEIKAGMVGEGAFEEIMAELDAQAATGNFDIVNNTMRAYAQLYDRFFADETKREIIKDKILASWQPLPIFLRIERILDLSATAVMHQDAAYAKVLIEQAQELQAQYRWPVDVQIAMTAQIAALRFQTGDREAARAAVDAALALYEVQSESIVTIGRAGTLRPLAEAYQKMGEPNLARKVYSMAIEAGVANPNSRPRAEDLAATCCSMALTAFEPATDQWAQMLAIFEGLGEPW